MPTNPVYGKVRYTNMVLQEDVFQLPARFFIKHVMHSDDILYFCQENVNDGAFLDWVEIDTIVLDGVEHKLKYTPAFSVPLGQYVFTVRI